VSCKGWMSNLKPFIFIPKLTMIKTSIKHLRKEWGTPNFLIELIGYCETIKELTAFNRDLYKMFNDVKSTEKYSTFEITVINEHFTTKFNELLKS
jgi:hypothetical protein